MSFAYEFGLQIDYGLIDGPARVEAVNPEQSFIVQAPAGSGKTALLAMRFLALLAKVEAPEQIVAMTFTKKAAAEMRERILKWLHLGAAPFPEHGSLMEKNVHRLAQKALLNDDEKAWNLLQNPGRLRIKTIDGLNSHLVAQMPLLSRMGAQMHISSQPDKLYQAAVRQAMQDSDVEGATLQLLELMNGRFARAEGLLISMLQKRDQWMPLLLKMHGNSVRDQLENSLEIIVQREFSEMMRVLKPCHEAFEQICRIAEFSQYKDQPHLSVIAGAWPLSSDIKALHQWQVLANWITTQKDSYRSPRGITKKIGFPTDAESKQQKQLFVEALESIELKDIHDEMLTALAEIKRLPNPSYEDQQWHSIEQFVQLLQYCVAYLKVIMQQQNEADFIEVAQAAELALGGEDAPTDLAQQLDYQIKHLLVDEFQDTSVQQFNLLQKLLASWQEGEDRSLFVVGDPMQSIYRFRQAEVANFLKAWQGSIGHWKVTPIKLEVNFRSSKAVVDWVNQSFVALLPEKDLPERGAVSYRASKTSPFNSEGESNAVEIHASVDSSTAQEAQQIVTLIEKRLQTFSNETDVNLDKTKSIAVLGRSRSSLMTIATALKQAGYSFRAVEIEGLSERQEIQDLQSLTLSLLHMGNRAAWIALLRSPLVGLSLKSIHHLIGDEIEQTVWQLLLSKAKCQGEIWQLDSQLADVLEEREQMALLLLLTSFSQALMRIGTVPMVRVLQELWVQLRGPLVLDDQLSLDNVQMYWQVLAQQDEASLNANLVAEMLPTLFSRADNSEQSRSIELMTMHKSKGLEFDTVILPGLGRAPAQDKGSLLDWYQFRCDQGLEHLVLAPIDQKGESRSKLRDVLRRFEKQKQNYETARVLYVAATRAKESLHLFANIKPPKDIEQEWLPARNSMLEILWPIARHLFQNLSVTAHQENEAVKNSIKVAYLDSVEPVYLNYLLHIQKQSTLPKQRVTKSNQIKRHHDEERHKQQGQNSALTVQMNIAVGNVVHQVLEGWAGLSRAQQAQSLQSGWPRYWLQQQGLQGDLLQQALQRVMQCLQNAHANSNMQIALSSHEVHAAEWSLSSVDENGQMAQHVIDRTWVDSQGVRWILDYKTSYYEGSNLREFIQQQSEQYRPQLQRYKALMHAMENRKVKSVLYFAAVDQWVELD